MNFREDFKAQPGPIKGTLNCKDIFSLYSLAPEKSKIPFEKSKTSILMIAGEDDQMAYSLECVEEAR